MWNRALTLGLLSLCLGVCAQASVDMCAGVFSADPTLGTEGSPHVIVLSAPSGGGKTTLAHLLLGDFPNLSISVSSTTRAPRGNEKDGVDYHFLTEAEFKAKIARGDFIEWAQVHGNYYGTDGSAIQDEFAKGHSVLALVDVKGAETLRRSFQDRVFRIFLNPPDMATLEERLRGRGTDSEESIRLRLQDAKKEMEAAPTFDAVVVNGDLQTAHQQLIDLIRDHHLVASDSDTSAAALTAK